MLGKRQKGPEYIRSKTNTQMLNYREYYMARSEKVMTVISLFIVGGVVGLIFYGNQFLDEEGGTTQATLICNIIVFGIAGVVAVLFGLPFREKQLKDKRIHVLERQFQSFLAALTVALSSGLNMTESLSSAFHDLKLQYSEDAYIVREVEEMLNGLYNGVDIETSMASLGERSGNQDIRNFGLVFSMCYRTGGNLKDVTRRTNEILSEKFEINQEIETALTSNKMQFSAMMFVPVLIMLMLRMMSSSFASGFSTAVGIMVITFAIFLFLIAYRMGMKIMDIKG